MLRGLAFLLAALVLPTVADARDLTGEWRGGYLCGQGPTALHLTISDTDHSEERHQVRVRFGFSATPTNPHVPSGSFEMSGIHDPNLHGEDVVWLQGESWVEQPAGWIMVDLHGWVDDGGDVISGRVYAQSGTNVCTEFFVMRDQSAGV